MKIDGPPFIVRFFIYVVIVGVGFVVARDLLMLAADTTERSSIQQTAPVATPTPAEAKKQAASEEVSSPSPPGKAEEPAPAKTAESAVVPKKEAAEGLLLSKPSEIIRLPEVTKGPAKFQSFPGKSLRTDEANLPTGDLRTGADSKPMGSLRSPTESGVTGSLRPDERSLPTGSLRSDESSLPMGSLR